MRATVIAASMCLSVLYLTACAVIPQRFEPRTAEEQAIARTLEAFLAAYRAQDFATIHTLAVPEATIRVGKAAHQRFQEGIVALRQGGITSDLLQVTPEKLVNFQRPRADSASVESFIHTYTDQGVENSQIRWELVQRDNQWLIAALIESSWEVHLHSRGSGP
jgi:hypothetical protein